MGNQPTTICCADTTGCQRVELASTSSYENGQNSTRGKPRLLRRVIDTFRPSPRAQPTSGFFKGKFASSTMAMETVATGHGTAHTRPASNFNHNTHSNNKPYQPRHDMHRGNQDISSSRQPPPHSQVRSLSSMSTQSEIGGERYDREARSDMLSRRSSYCSAREGVEEAREQLEPEGDRLSKPPNE
ncbi:expressed unknown protein [Seminavis robusta]|uniref:Uncharacterized protein n=1 Tax=Seminavis robusta TaxID=568900 RepID=A0A9N8DZX2_9STRA|nr:expressed unknown protein [Seminavis robusta]|eukprot:Sro399_g134900.1 n/a (186) ;mRNA; f:39885-40442